ncbi:MAG: hypothetical protein FWE90_09360 [Defluviitaleaceae bacterium]|nr:hypothetical protein [Defluviitaleaceae bacterium]
MSFFKKLIKAVKKVEEIADAVPAKKETPVAPNVVQEPAAEEKAAPIPAPAPTPTPVAVKPKRDEEDEALWQRYILLEPIVREILLTKYNHKLPPGLFDESQPERERRKRGFRDAFNEYGGDVDNLDMTNKDDVNETAGAIASAVREFISEEALDPFSEEEWA